MINNTEKAIIYDNDNNKYEVDIIITAPKIHFDITNDKMEIGFVDVIEHSDKMINLDIIYIKEEYQNKGIGTKIIKLIDYLLKDYNGYIIKGDFLPFTFKFEKADSLKKRTKAFYEKNGYNIISIKEYIYYMEMYPKFDLVKVFHVPCKSTTSIIYKQIKKQDEYDFYVDNGIYLHKDYVRIRK